jgi:hypothetical protein
MGRIPIFSPRPGGERGRWWEITLRSFAPPPNPIPGGGREISGWRGVALETERVILRRYAPFFWFAPVEALLNGSRSIV